MRSDELVTSTIIGGALSSVDDTYTAARLRIELWNTLTEAFGRSIVNARDGYWLQQQVVACEVGLPHYRIPHRAVVGGLEDVEISYTGYTPGTAQWAPLVPETQRRASSYEQNSSTQTRRFFLNGDQVTLLPAPQSTAYLRFTYYLRAPQIVAYQVKGAITEIDLDNRLITVADVPIDDAGGDIAGGYIDVVRSDGWHECTLVDAPVTTGETPIHYTVTDPLLDLTRMKIGDYVRRADQSEWPAIPDDFHRSLCDLTAARINRAKGVFQKADALEQSAAGDVQRFSDLINPRVKSAPKIVKGAYGPIRRRGFVPTPGAVR